MHILRLTPHFYWPQLSSVGWPVRFDAIGGMQSQIFRQTVALSELGVQQTVLTLKIPGAPAMWELDNGTIVRGVRLSFFPVRSRIRGMMDLNVSWALGVVREILRSHPKYQIVHVHCSGVFWPLLVGIVAARLINARLVLTVHCSVLATYEAMNLLDHTIQPFSRFIEHYALRKAAHVVALSHRSREAFLEQAKINSEKVSVVPDSIDIEHFRSLASPEAVTEFRQRYALPIDRPIIIYVGRIAREKGWRRLINVAERLRHRPFHFLVCGDGNERDLMEAQIKRRNLTERFTITGYIPQETVPAALSCASVLLLTSLHEEFGSVLIEGMAMQVPQVAFSVGGIPDVVPDGETGLLVPASNTEIMARAIERIINDRALSRQMGEASLERVRQHFSLKASCCRLYNIYREVA